MPKTSLPRIDRRGLVGEHAQPDAGGGEIVHRVDEEGAKNIVGSVSIGGRVRKQLLEPRA